MLHCKTLLGTTVSDVYTLTRMLRSEGITNVIGCRDSRQVYDLCERLNIGIMLLDLGMPFLSGEEILSAVRADFPWISVIIVTGNNETSIAVECMKNVAVDFLSKPISRLRLVSSLMHAIENMEIKEENKRLRRQVLSRRLEKPRACTGIITGSSKMKSICNYVMSISKTSEPVLISGETGVGKDLVARAVHTLSERTGEYVAVNAAGLDDGMFSDTLFGHMKGAFTGASGVRHGMIKRAAGGTLFLDEIGDLSIASQVKLLRVVENREYYPVGSDDAVKTDVRIIVATNRKLAELVGSGVFRKDLYYRLSTHEVEIPPLRERRGDIPLLFNHFAAEAADEFGKRVFAPSPELYSLLKAYSFPGNVRELRSIVYVIMKVEITGPHKVGGLMAKW